MISDVSRHFNEIGSYIFAKPEYQAIRLIRELSRENDLAGLMNESKETISA